MPSLRMPVLLSVRSEAQIATPGRCVADAFPNGFPGANAPLLAARRGLCVQEARMYPGRKGRSVHNALLQSLLPPSSLSLSLPGIELRCRCAQLNPFRPAGGKDR